MTARRTGIALGAAAVVMLAAVWRLLPPGTPPLYDGLCLVNPYQYLAPPAGSSAPAATDASKDLDVSGGQPGTELITGESPPQATVEFGEGVLNVPTGTAKLHLSIRPVPPPPVAPGDGRVDGNVYRVQVTSDRGVAVEPAGGRTGEVLLRPTDPNGGALVIERFDGSRWMRLDTTVSSCADTQAAVTSQLGEFAVVVSGGPSPGGGGGGESGSGGAAPVGAIVLTGIVAILAGVIILVRFSRSRPRP